MKVVAALCVSSRSIYHTMSGVEAYDAKRDARTFPGGMPVVAHPPCRTWSAFCRQQVKATEEQIKSEQELGLWCVGQVQANGGVLEQPAHSHLWSAAGLPRPGANWFGGPDWSLEVWQSWWGYSVKKSTWLYFYGVHPEDVETPLRLHNKGADRRAVQLMSHNQRSETCQAFAEWLVSLARKASI